MVLTNAECGSFRAKGNVHADHVVCQVVVEIPLLLADAVVDDPPRTVQTLQQVSVGGKKTTLCYKSQD